MANKEKRSPYAERAADPERITCIRDFIAASVEASDDVLRFFQDWLW